MRFLLRTVLVLTLLIPSAAFAARLDLTGVDVDRFTKYYDTLPPTPKGSGHLGPIKSGDVIHMRYSLPKNRPLSLKLDFHNIVAYEGIGQSYQLQLHRDSPAGKIIYDGPVADSNFFNSSNRTTLEAADWLTSEDFARGFLDVYAITRVVGDTWTMYRDDNGSEHDLRCSVIEDSPELRKAIAGASMLRAKGIHLLPMPQKISPTKDDFIVTPETRILVSASAGEDDLFTASLLQEEIKRLSRFTLPVCKGFTGASKGDILLGCQGKVPKGDQAYHLLTGGRFEASANTSTGLFYAVQTAIQLLQKRDGHVYFSGCEIVDRPSLEYRMFQYDIARYQTVNVPYIKRLIREMSRFKLNQLMFYMEDDFKYTKYPFTGKPGSFTPEKARELVAYARKYHVELVPQLEALGHATALLSHPEFADLRENGNAWVFDTSNPRTWQVLDDMIGELAEVFDNTRLIHLGGDEFEDAFGQCPRCKEKIAKTGWGGLYAEHMSRLNEFAKKHSRTMIFWPSHGGSGEDVQGDITLKYAGLLPKDIVPMEWIYHAPISYPTIQKYQEAGFSRIFVGPGVMGYSMLYPDYGVTFRSVSGFYQAGAKRKVMGGCACTWELGWGAQLETHLYGIVYSANCAWNTRACGEDAFDRAFASHWFGLSPDDPADIQRIFHMENLRKGDGIVWSNSAGTGTLFWTGYSDLMKRQKDHWPQLVAAAPDMDRSASEALDLIDKLKAKANRNTVTLDAVAHIVRVYRATARKIMRMDEASKFYRQAVDAQGEQRVDLLQRTIEVLKPLQADYPEIIDGFKRNRDERGGAAMDVDNAEKVVKSLDELLTKLNTSLDSLRKDPSAALPAAEEIGM